MVTIARNLYRIILKRRTIRLFKNKKVPPATIMKVIEAARVAPSAANLQFLEYMVIDKDNLKKRIFPHTRWAGYVYPRRVPPARKRPSCYILILINNTRAQKPDLRDVGAAAENILLALSCFGFGGCWIASINRRPIRRLFHIPSKYTIDSLIAVGFPDESPVLESEQATVKYWLDKRNRLHVPKRPLKNILHYNVVNLKA